MNSGVLAERVVFALAQGLYLAVPDRDRPYNGMAAFKSQVDQPYFSRSDQNGLPCLHVQPPSSPDTHPDRVGGGYKMRRLNSVSSSGAREKGPQRVTVHGRDAVVIVDADEWDRLRKPVSGRDLVEALANSPLGDVPIERVSVKSRVRDVKL